MTFTRLLERVRVETARKWLQSTDCSIADIAVSEISDGFHVIFPADSRLEMFENGVRSMLQNIAHFTCSTFSVLIYHDD